jgi:hypothetical protein
MTFADYIIYIFNLGVAMGAVFAFIMIAYYGSTLLNTQGNPSAVSNAKRKILNCLLGLAVLIVSYVLLTTINPDIVVIRNISLGNVNINVPIFSSQESVALKTYTFEEIPIGTLTEYILAGTSSNSNKLPCYEYEYSYGSDSNIIMGNTIDQNGDGKIDDKDILLNKDPFYCMKLLGDAIQKKTEVHLNKLIEGLDEAMKDGCTCTRCYKSALPPFFNPLKEYEIKPGTGKCPCDSCSSNCNCCGSAGKGCEALPPLSNITDSTDGYLQYKYDPCKNRKEVECKSQAIRQLMDGTEPEAICYSKGFITKAPANLFTIKQGLERMQAFKAYFDKMTSDLARAELKTKEPWGERLTLAEFHELENTAQNKIIEETKYEGNDGYDYDISRYCSSNEDRKLNKENRICDIGADKEYYFYDGDPATFYYGPSYNEEVKSEKPDLQSKDTCSILEEKGKGTYAGVIPIGEAVDASEAWGEEVSRRIQGVIDEVQGIYNSGMAIYYLPEGCNCGNCKNKASNCCIGWTSCCRATGCCCPSVHGESCKDCEPSAWKCKVRRDFYSSCTQPEMEPYQGCDSCCGEGGCPAEIETEDQHWVCPYENFCLHVRNIYQAQEIDDSCFDKSNDEKEQAKRAGNLEKIGFLQRLGGKVRVLLDISKTQINDSKSYQVLGEDELADLPKLICPNYLQTDKKKLICDKELNASDSVENRFDLLQKLNFSRTKLTGCIAGYSYPNKELDAWIFNCREGIDSVVLNELTVTPDFPYPNTKNKGYYNCYPYNSSSLTDEQKDKCFENIDRYGDETDPKKYGCQLEVKSYMDNYYCCRGHVGQ